MSLLWRILRGPFAFMLPGIKLKRWMFLLLTSAVLFAVGMGGWLGETLGPYRRTFNVPAVRRAERSVRLYLRSLKSLDLWLIGLGGVGMLFAVRRGYYAILAVFVPNSDRRFIRHAYERARGRRGPRIVAIGGGTGLPNLLTGLKEYSDNLTAVVTVADDGGSSGRLRRQFRILPPGDIRNCLVALADAEPLMGRLFQHRFSRKGDLAGHTFGNIFLTALAEVSGDFSHALAESSRVLAVRGRVVPVTLDLVTLAAKLKDGRTVKGESRIAAAGSPVDHVTLVPARVRVNPEALRAIARADILVIGPGSLFTSVVPNLLVPGMPEAVAHTRAVKIYVSNIMTEPGETDGFSAADHLAVVQRYLGPRCVSGVVVNVEPPSPRQLARYHAENAEVIPLDEARLRAQGVGLVRARLLAADRDYIRHDPAKLARTVVKFAVI